MISLNLLPDVKKEFLRAQKLRNRTIAYTILITIVVVGLTALLAAYTYGVQTLLMAAQTSDIKSKETKLRNEKDISKYLTVQNQLNNLSKLHQSKNIYSRLLDYLPVVNPPAPQNAQLVSVEVGAESKEITLKGSIVDFAALTTFKDTLSNADLNYNLDDKTATEKLFSHVSVTSAAYSSSEKGRVIFTISLTYTENAFSNAIKNVTVSVPTIETTQSVIQSPQSLFDEGASDGE